jgi:hypothetical protein
MLMSEIIKYYLDIGCIYEGDECVESMYCDYQNWDIKDYGLLGILKLKIDVKKRKKEEIFFRQVFSPHVHQFARGFLSDIVHRCDRGILGDFSEYGDADLIVGWNSRDFDLPIIVNKLGYSRSVLQRIMEKDRDLLDLCILREIPVKGGLEEVVKRLKIDHDLRCKGCPEFSKEEKCFLKSFDMDINRYNNNMKMIKQKNEFDVKILPLLEEKLGYLYDLRIIQDKFHKKWI